MRFRLVRFLIALVPAWLMIPHILRRWVNIPYWDDWGTPGKQIRALHEGNLTLASLLAQHNESRPFFPRLVLLAIEGAHWDVRKAMVATFLVVLLAAYFLSRVFDKMPGSPLEKLGALLVVSGILFWPNTEIWTFENTFMMVWPPTALVCAVAVNLSPVSLARKVLVNVALAAIATFSWANGMLLWAFALPLPAALLAGLPREGKKENPILWYAVYTLACAVCMGIFMHGYHHGVLSWDIPAVSVYFFTWVGGFFGSIDTAWLTGVCVVAAFFSLAFPWCFAARKRGNFIDGYPWLTLGVYGMASGWLTAMGRAKLGLEQALSPRYTAVSGYIYIGLVGFAWLLLLAARRAESKKFRLAVWCTASVAALFLIPMVSFGYYRGLGFMEATQALRKTVRAAWQWSRVAPGNAGLSLMAPFPVDFRTGEELEDAGILSVKRFSPDIAAGWDFSAKPGEGAVGYFDNCQIVPVPGGVRILFEGWTRLPDRIGPADYVIITYSKDGGAPHLFLVLPSDTQPRTDVMMVLKDKRMYYTGFRQDLDAGLLPSGELKFQAWAVDMKNRTIAPLANAFVREITR